jgi:predicted MPP superfamily phosphohydrolase
MQYLALLIAAIFSILGYARIAAFIINHAVFGNRHERDSLLKWVLVACTVMLLALSVLFVPLIRAVSRDVWSAPAVAGGVWLAFSAAVGAGWVVSRALHHRRPPVSGVETLESRVVSLRKPHIHYPALQRLGLHNEVYDLEINHHAVFIPDLPPLFDGYRIGFLSDTHVAGFMRRTLYRACLDALAEFRCDAVIFGGDLVTWRRHIYLMAELLTDGLKPPDGVYAVLGNHDYWSDADGVIAALTARGVRFIHNRAVKIEREGQSIYIAGLDEVYRGDPDPALVFSQIPSAVPRVLVSHHPDIVDVIRDERIDLMLCGHTHGGQIRFPFFGALLVPSVHETRYDMGFFRVRNMLMYVGRGVGAVPPIRILCRPEVPIFELRRSPSDRLA